MASALQRTQYSVDDTRHGASRVLVREDVAAPGSLVELLATDGPGPRGGVGLVVRKRDATSRVVLPAPPTHVQEETLDGASLAAAAPPLPLSLSFARVCSRRSRARSSAPSHAAADAATPRHAGARAREPRQR